MSSEQVDAIVVGAGFGGLYMVHRLREMGLSVQGIEAGDDVGGTWYWNRYPGARCDVESVAYSFSFSPELDRGWRWSERYAAQPEIHAYLRYAAERLDLRRLFRFDTRVVAAHYDESANAWTVRIGDGEALIARFVIMATGPLSASRMPDIPGIAEFAGEVYHTADWPRRPVDFVGKRVGVIGTGSSGTQLIPVAAQSAAQVTVFQRTPNYSVPAMNRDMSDEEVALWHGISDNVRDRMRQGEVTGSGDTFLPDQIRTTRSRPAADFSEGERHEVLEARWQAGGALLPGAFQDVMLDPAVNESVAEFARAKIRAIVKDPVTAEKLIPKGYPFGAKRLCVDTGFYEAFNRDNVDLIDIRAEPIEAVVPQGVRLPTRDVALDMLVFATGFDAMTGALARIDIVGRSQERLIDVWSAGPVNYLGIAVHGFPNLFMIGGPGSPSALSNVVMSNEYHVELIGDLIAATLDRGDKATAEPDIASQEAWVLHVNEVAARTLFMQANSWYLGANVPGKPRVFMPYAGGIGAYRRKGDTVRAGGFRELLGAA